MKHRKMMATGLIIVLGLFYNGYIYAQGTVNTGNNNAGEDTMRVVDESQRPEDIVNQIALPAGGSQTLDENTDSEMGETRQIREQNRERVQGETQQNSFMDQTRERAMDQTQDQLMEQTREQAMDQTQDQLMEQTREQVMDQTREQVMDQTQDQLMEQTREQAMDQYEDRIADQAGRQSETQGQYQSGENGNR
ncbi:MAG: hypothetical protein AB1724_02515 [Thermodesulfobacteriota bacterium]